jgi:hypothetical protein
LSAALLLTLSLLSAQPAELRAQESNPSDTLAMADSSAVADPLHAAPYQESRAQASGGTDTKSDRSFENDQPMDGATTSTANSNRPGRSGSGQSGNGDGLSVTHSTFARDPEMNGTDHQSGSGNQTAGGGNSDPGAGNENGSTGTSSSPVATKQAPNWSGGAGTPENGSAKNNGHVPDWAGDLVRAYFQRD